MTDTKILVIDDDPNISDLLKIYFENDSTTVSQYESIKEKCSSFIELSFGSNILDSERMIKSDTEILLVF